VRKRGAAPGALLAEGPRYADADIGQWLAKITEDPLPVQLGGAKEAAAPVAAIEFTPAKQRAAAGGRGPDEQGNRQTVETSIRNVEKYVKPAVHQNQHPPAAPTLVRYAWRTAWLSFWKRQWRRLWPTRLDLTADRIAAEAGSASARSTRPLRNPSDQASWAQRLRGGEGSCATASALRSDFTLVQHGDRLQCSGPPGWKRRCRIT